MSIPGAMMPGQGGPPPGAGSPGGGGISDLMAGGPQAIMQLLSKFQESPPPDGEDQMLGQASMMINAAYARIAPRSAKAAKSLAEANVKIQAAREALKSEGSRPLPGPPDLMGGMSAGGGLPGMGAM